MHLVRPSPRLLLGPAATLAVAATGFGLLADAASEGDGVTRVDPSVASDVLTLRTGYLTTVARILSLVGSEAVVGVLSLGLVVVLLERRGPRRAGLAAVAMAISAALTVGVKLSVARDRPGTVDRLGAVDSTFSFPSGHTLNSAVFLGLVCLLLVPQLTSRPARLTTYVLAAVLAAAIGCSRLYLGYHWTTDVLASWFIAAALLSVVRATDRMIGDRAPRQDDDVARRESVDS